MPRTATVAVALLLALAGCIAGGPAATGGDASTTDHPTTTDSTTNVTPSTTTTKTPSTAVAPEPVADCASTWVSFWGLGNEAVRNRNWNPDGVRIGYRLPAGQSLLFVAFVDGDVAGWMHAAAPQSGDGNTTGYGITADGDEVPLESALSGTHDVRVVAYEDTDGDGAFDPDADQACAADGELVSTGTETLNFSDFDAGADHTTSPS